MSRDISMTAKLLQLVNSAFFGLRRHVASPGEAVKLLGLDTIKALVLSVQIFSHFDHKQKGAFALDVLWQAGLRSLGIVWSRPSVTATAACSGLRPVAKAFGWSDGIRYSRGTGSRARAARSCTVASSHGIVPGSTGRARLALSASRSENQ